jgi:adenosylmethionine-8-amino-7-oxononanoate aminotransferase
MPKIPKINGIPYVTGNNDPLWHNMGDDLWEHIEKQLNLNKDTLSGILFEPILQGAGGMKIYSPDFLNRLRKWADINSVHLIADEIMTGFGRTGKYLACDHAGITPDFICLSKGLTAGWGPMAVVMTSNEIYDAFYDDYFSGKAFMHSNTYCGYPIAAAAALEALNIYEREHTMESVTKRSKSLLDRMQYIANETGSLVNLRSVGFLVAADIIDPQTALPFPKKLRIGYQCYKNAVKNGAFLRPLGDTLYFLPPLNTPDLVLDDLADITIKSLKEVLK